MSVKLKFCASIVAVLAIIVLSQTACDSGSSVSVPQSDVTATLRKGFSAPDIEGTDLAGEPMKLSDFRGKVVVLEFWSST